MAPLVPLAPREGGEREARRGGEGGRKPLLDGLIIADLVSVAAFFFFLLFILFPPFSPPPRLPL